MLFVALIIALSAFLAQDMLETASIMPSLEANQHVRPLANSSDQAFAVKIKKWHQAPQHLVYFFAPWCTVCALSQPSLAGFAEIKPDTQIIMVALDWDTEQAVREFKQKHQFDLPILLGDPSLKQQWKIDAYPSYYFVDSNGKITSKDRGLVTLPGLLARSI